MRRDLLRGLGRSPLFLKVFGWFWISILSMAALLALALQFFDLEIIGIRWVPLTEEAAIQLYARTAAETFERGGKDALRNLMGEYKTKLPANGYLFNEAGVDVLGGRAPAEVTALIRQPVDSRQIEVKISMSHTLVLSPATGPSGAAYRLVGIIPRQPGSIVPVFGWNWGWGIGISILVLSAGDLGVRVTDGALKARRDEFTELGEDFDAIASQIEKLVSGKQQLLWDISHELRSPLTRLSLALSIARRKCSPGTASALDRMERETEQLNGLIEQLLKLARMSGGTGPSLTDELDLEEVVREIAGDAAFEASAMNRNVTWTVDVQGHVSGARELLRSAMENVVRNAIRYTPEETDVTIHLGG
jgi:two-component system sensor histidine kinase CpxA